MVDAAQLLLASTSTLAAGSGVVVGAAACVPVSILAARLLNLPAKISAITHRAWVLPARPLALVGLGLAACLMLGLVSLGASPMMPVLAAVSLLGGMLMMAIAPVGQARQQEQAIVVKPVRRAPDAQAATKPAKPAKPEPRKAA